jgi:hypothetical protein
MMTDDTSPLADRPPNAALERLAAFAGTWTWEATLHGQPFGTGQTVFALQEGGAFLLEHSDADQPEFPSSTAMIGADDVLGTYCMLQVDSRGYARIYQMRLEADVWRMWRDAPGFAQRFTGTFSADGRTIQGLFEKSEDGGPWEYDFDLTYTKG